MVLVRLVKFNLAERLLEHRGVLEAIPEKKKEAECTSCFRGERRLSDCGTWSGCCSIWPVLTLLRQPQVEREVVEVCLACVLSMVGTLL